MGFKRIIKKAAKPMLAAAAVMPIASTLFSSALGGGPGGEGGTAATGPVAQKKQATLVGASTNPYQNTANFGGS